MRFELCCMPLIKSANTPSAITPFSMTDIAKQAAAVMARAQKRADAMLEEAQKAGEELKAAAHAEGRVQGHRAGIAAGLSEGRRAGHDEAIQQHGDALTAVVGSLTTAVQEIDQRRREFEAGVLREVVELALQIAGRLTKREGRFDPTVLERNLGESLKLVVGMHKLRVAIHPDQKDALSDALPRLKLEFPTLEHAELVADESIAPGGCRVLTRQGMIDATLDEQLNRIAADLFPGVDVV